MHIDIIRKHDIKKVYGWIEEWSIKHKCNSPKILASSQDNETQSHGDTNICRGLLRLVYFIILLFKKSKQAHAQNMQGFALQVIIHSKLLTYMFNAL